MAELVPLAGHDCKVGDIEQDDGRWAHCLVCGQRFNWVAVGPDDGEWEEVE